MSSVNTGKFLLNFLGKDTISRTTTKDILKIKGYDVCSPILHVLRFAHLHLEDGLAQARFGTFQSGTYLKL
jgi:hypothetical protein